MKQQIIPTGNDTSLKRIHPPACCFEKGTRAKPYEVDYMIEEEALKRPPCRDPKQPADLNMSRLSIPGTKKAVYRLGETVLVAVHLYDGYGKPLKHGGAVLRARMFNLEHSAFATAYVTDHDNGTYTAMFKALWTGNVTIKVKIAYTPETIRAIYYTRQKIFLSFGKDIGRGSNKLDPELLGVSSGSQLFTYDTMVRLNGATEIYGEFSVNNFKEKTLCHSMADVLRNGTNVRICNLTGDNSGMPWYCIKPGNIHLLCEDWTANKLRKPKLPLTSCEAVALHRSQASHSPTKSQNRNPRTSYIPFGWRPVSTILVEAGHQTKRSRRDIDQSIQFKVEGAGAIIPLPSDSCKKFNVTDLWTLKQPTGFVYNKSWHLLHCKGHGDKDKMSCLKNKTVLLFGDSTVRQWYSYISRTCSCNPITEQMTTTAWHKRVACENKENNFSVQWLPHSQPILWTGDKRYTTTSIARHLDEQGRDERMIVVIHLYVHMLGYHHNVFKMKIRKIRESIDKLLSRNKYVSILIKGPHTFDDSHGCHLDFYAPVYKRIMFDEFRGLHDKIIFLDNKDISDAGTSNDIHPPDFVVGAMVNQFLSYICY